MSLTSPDARAVVAAVDRLTTQVRRLADGASTPAVAPDDAPTTTPATTCSARYAPPGGLMTECIRAAHHEFPRHTDSAGLNWSDAVAIYPTADDAPARVITHWGPLSEQRFEEMRDNARQLTDWITERAQQTSAADEDAQRTARRERLHNLLARADRGTLTPGETAALRDLVDAEVREADTIRAVAAGNKRHVQLLHADLEEAQSYAKLGAKCYRDHHPAQIAEERARAASWKERAERLGAELEQVQAAINRVRALRDPIAEAIEQADYSGNMRRGDLADSVMPVILAALDGTDQGTTEEH